MWSLTVSLPSRQMTRYEPQPLIPPGVKYARCTARQPCYYHSAITDDTTEGKVDTTSGMRLRQTRNVLWRKKSRHSRLPPAVRVAVGLGCGWGSSRGVPVETSWIGSTHPSDIKLYLFRLAQNSSNFSGEFKRQVSLFAATKKHATNMFDIFMFLTYSGICKNIYYVLEF